MEKIENSFVLLPNHNLKVGEKVKLIFEENQEVVEVKSISKLGFQISETPKSKTSNQQVFVYGREVSDFRSVDNEALTTLNISATQEILKKIIQLEKQNSALKSEIKDIRADINDLKLLILR